MDRDYQIDDRLKRKRELTKARVKKYRTKRRTEAQLQNSLKQEYLVEKVKKKRVRKILKENDIERKRALAKERSRRFRERKRLNDLKSIHESQIPGPSHGVPPLVLRNQRTMHNYQVAVTSADMIIPQVVGDDLESFNCVEDNLLTPLNEENQPAHVDHYLVPVKTELCTSPTCNVPLNRRASNRRHAKLETAHCEDIIPKLKDKNKKSRPKICEQFRPSHIKTGNVKYLTNYSLPIEVVPTVSANQHQDTQNVYVPPDITEQVMPTITNIISVVNLRNQARGSQQPQASLNPSADFGNILPQPAEETKPSLTNLNAINKEDFLKLCKKFMNNSWSELIKWQILGPDSKIGNCETLKFFAQGLHYSDPATYTFLKDTFCLPDLTTLKNLIKPIDTKFDEHTLTALKTKVDRMAPLEKICSVSVTCMPLKKNIYYDIKHDQIIGFHEINGTQKPLIAKYVVVVMVAGIVYKWKLPVAHAFVGKSKDYSDVTSWIDETLACLIIIGLDVRAFISELGSEFVSDSKSRGVDVNKTYFEVNGQKIYYMYNIPHLMKSVMYNLQTCNFIYDDCKVAKWSDIKDTLCIRDKNNHSKIFQTMSEKLVPDVLNHTVSEAMNTYIDLNLLNESARDTAEFIDKISNLFDLLNSSSLRSAYKFKRAYSGQDFQVKFLLRMLNCFANLKLKKVDTNADTTKTKLFIKGFQISIKSIMSLQEDLQTLGVKFLKTKRMNQDAFEIFGRKVRRADESRQELTCRQISKAFKEMFTCGILQKPVGTNCQENLNSLLIRHQGSQLFYETIQASRFEVSMEYAAIAIGTTDYRFKLPADNALVYVSAYLYRKCIEIHTCEQIISYIKEMTDDPLFIDDINDNNDQLETEVDVIPPNDFVEFIGLLESQFCQYLDSEHYSTHIGHGLLKSIEHCRFEMQCPCFPIGYLKKLFVRLRIYNTVKRKKNFKKTIFSPSCLLFNINKVKVEISFDDS